MNELPRRVLVAWAFFALGVLAAIFALKALANRVYRQAD